MNGKPKRPLRFQGFVPELFDFLRQLKKNNNKLWFDAHKNIYESCLIEPVKALTTEAGQILRWLNPDFDTEARIGKTISQLNNRSRGERHKPAYNPFIQVKYTSRNAKRSKSAAMYIGINGHGVSVGFYPSGSASAGAKQHDVMVGPVQQAIASNQRVFHQYLTERRIPQRYWELAGSSDGEITKWSLPRATRRWAAIDSLLIGEHFSASDATMRDRVFLYRVQEILLDLYPLWIFAESECVKEDFELYRENAHRISTPSSNAAD